MYQGLDLDNYWDGYADPAEPSSGNRRSGLAGSTSSDLQLALQNKDYEDTGLFSPSYNSGGSYLDSGQRFGVLGLFTPPFRREVAIYDTVHETQCHMDHSGIHVGIQTTQRRHCNLHGTSYRTSGVHMSVGNGGIGIRSFATSGGGNAGVFPGRRRGIFGQSHDYPDTSYSNDPFHAGDNYYRATSTESDEQQGPIVTEVDDSDEDESFESSRAIEYTQQSSLTETVSRQNSETEVGETRDTKRRNKNEAMAHSFNRSKNKNVVPERKLSNSNTLLQADNDKTDTRSVTEATMTPTFHLIEDDTIQRTQASTEIKFNKDTLNDKATNKSTSQFINSQQQDVPILGLGETLDLSESTRQFSYTEQNDRENTEKELFELNEFQTCDISEYEQAESQDDEKEYEPVMIVEIEDPDGNTNAAELSNNFSKTQNIMTRQEIGNFVSSDIPNSDEKHDKLTVDVSIIENEPVSNINLNLRDDEAINIAPKIGTTPVSSEVPKTFPLSDNASKTKSRKYCASRTLGLSKTHILSIDGSEGVHHSNDQNNSDVAITYTAKRDGNKQNIDIFKTGDTDDKDKTDKTIPEEKYFSVNKEDGLAISYNSNAFDQSVEPALNYDSGDEDEFRSLVTNDTTSTNKTSIESKRTSFTYNNYTNEDNVGCELYLAAEANKPHNEMINNSSSILNANIGRKISISFKDYSSGIYRQRKTVNEEDNRYAHQDDVPTNSSLRNERPTNLKLIQTFKLRKIPHVTDDKSEIPKLTNERLKRTIDKDKRTPYANNFDNDHIDEQTYQQKETQPASHDKTKYTYQSNTSYSFDLNGDGKDNDFVGTSHKAAENGKAASSIDQINRETNKDLSTKTCGTSTDKIRRVFNSVQKTNYMMSSPDSRVDKTNHLNTNQVTQQMNSYSTDTNANKRDVSMNSDYVKDFKWEYPAHGTALAPGGNERDFHNAYALSNTNQHKINHSDHSKRISSCIEKSCHIDCRPICPTIPQPACEFCKKEGTLHIHTKSCTSETFVFCNECRTVLDGEKYLKLVDLMINHGKGNAGEPPKPAKKNKNMLPDKESLIYSTNTSGLSVIDNGQDNKRSHSYKRKYNRSNSDMSEKIAKAGLVLKDVPPDGNCLFAAVVDQLRVRGEFFYTTRTLRRAAVTYLREHPRQSDGTELVSYLTAFDGTWDQYLRRMSREGEWGDHLVISAIANILQRRLVIMNNTSDKPTIQIPERSKNSLLTQVNRAPEKDSTSENHDDESNKRPVMENNDSLKVDVEYKDETENDPVTENETQNSDFDKIQNGTSSIKTPENDNSAKHSLPHQANQAPEKDSTSENHDDESNKRPVTENVYSLKVDVESKDETENDPDTDNETQHSDLDNRVKITSSTKTPENDNSAKDGSTDEFEYDDLHLGHISEAHYVSLRHHDWENRLHEVLRSKTTSCFLYYGNNTTPQKDTSRQTSFEDQDSKDDSYTSKQVTSPQLPDVQVFPEVHISFLTKFLRQLELPDLSAQRIVLSREETLYGSYICTSDISNRLGNSITQYEESPFKLNHASHSITGTSETGAFKVIMLPNDTKVLQGNSMHCNNKDLIAVENGDSVGSIKLKPVSPDMWKPYAKTIAGETSIAHFVNKRFASTSSLLGFKCDWPAIAEEWISRKRKADWPPKDLKSRVIAEGAIVLPECRAITSTPGMDWAYSFCVAEQMLFDTGLTGPVKFCFKLFKIISSFIFQQRDCITEEHLKVVFYDTCENFLREQFVDESGKCLGYMLSTLERCLAEHVLPDYFTRQRNLVEHTNSRELDWHADTLRAFQRHFIEHIYLLFMHYGWTNFESVEICLDSLIEDAQRVALDGQSPEESYSTCFNQLNMVVIQERVKKKEYYRAKRLSEEANQELLKHSVQKTRDIESFYQGALKGLTMFHQWLFAFYLDFESSTGNLMNYVCSEEEYVVLESVFGDQLVQRLVAIKTHLNGNLRIPVRLAQQGNLTELATNFFEVLYGLDRDAYCIATRYFLKKNTKELLTNITKERNEGISYSEHNVTITNLENMLRNLHNSYYEMQQGDQFRELVECFDMLCSYLVTPHNYTYLAELWERFGETEKAAEASMKAVALGQGHSGNYAFN